MKITIDDIARELKNVPVLDTQLEKAMPIIRQKISELVRECVGERIDEISKPETSMGGYERGLNQAKSEILAAFKEAGIKI